MSLPDVAAAMQRVEEVLRQRPQAAVRDDAPATARWEGGLRVVSTHANGTRVATDMPAPLGGSGDEVTPGWVLRAALASCAVTRITMSAAAAGIELQALEVEARSRSDARGLLGMSGADGEPVGPQPIDLELHVKISAPGVAAARLRALVETSHRCSPVSSALERALPIAVHIENPS